MRLSNHHGFFLLKIKIWSIWNLTVGFFNGWFECCLLTLLPDFYFYMKIIIYLYGGFIDKIVSYSWLPSLCTFCSNYFSPIMLLNSIWIYVDDSSKLSRWLEHLISNSSINKLMTKIHRKTCIMGEAWSYEIQLRD